MQEQNSYLRGFITALVFITLFWGVQHSQANSEIIYQKINKGLFFFREVFREVSRNYVDEIDAEKLSKSAIQGMLQEFDPYTVFFEDPGAQQMQLLTKGTYGGVGLEINVRDGQLIVISPIVGSPAMRAGIRAGDILTEIEGKSTVKISSDDAVLLLRGEIGTSVEVSFRRPDGQHWTIMLPREEITIRDVTYAGFLQQGTVYIQLSGFSEKADQELKVAIEQLATQGNIQRIILDLRNNPGGLLSSAVKVANVFIPPAQLIVSTRGLHEEENRFYTSDQPLLPNQPMVVLVNESSASAAEIVAGALQDLDRAVLIGNRTFGKGLVQRLISIDPISQAYLKITTAKYYMPSGRLIQKEDYKKNRSIYPENDHNSEFDKNIPFRTSNGRSVYGGGGVLPDIIVAENQIDAFVGQLRGQGYLFQFVVNFLAKNPEVLSSGKLPIDGALLDRFEEYVNQAQSPFLMPGEKELRTHLQIANDQEYDSDLQDLVKVALQKLKQEQHQQFIVHNSIITQLLAAEFAGQINGPAAHLASMQHFDSLILRANQVLHNQQTYQSILAADQ